MFSSFQSHPGQLKLHTEKREFPECTFYYIDGELGKTQGKLIGKLDTSKNNFFIQDIICTRENAGLGSMLLDTAIKIAKENNIKSMDGYLSDVDIGHIDKLRHFYSKFGFVITPSDESGKIATIHLDLE